MTLTRALAAAAFCLFWATVAPGKESVCLTTGFCIKADSHTQRNGTLILQSGAGTMEFPISEVAQIIVLADAQPSLPAQVVKPEDLVTQAALQQGLEPQFLRSVARVESGFRQQAISPKGAVGLMQLMPATAAALRVDAGAAEQNAQGGAQFLRALLLRYQGDAVLALAAYNAGPAAVTRFGGVPPYLETRRYVLKVLQDYQRQQKLRAGAKPNDSKGAAGN